MKKHLSVIIFFIVVAIIWQIIATSGMFHKVSFPTLQQIGEALINGIMNQGLLLAVAYSMTFIIEGMAIGIVLSLIMSALSILSKSVYSIYYTLINIFDPLPGIALLPLAMMWFGAGDFTLIFLMIHGILWPMSRNVLDGYNSTPKTYLEVGENIGLSGWRLVTGVYMPASLPFIISGIKTGWARAWRALISAEMIFGAASGIIGIGMYIFMRRYQMDMAGVIASLIVIIIVGMIVENVVFAQIEKRTIKKWGMVR